MSERHGERRAVPESEPAPVISSKARTAEWVERPGWHRKTQQPTSYPPGISTPVFRSNAMRNAAERPATEPAPTITAGHDAAERVWLRAGTNAHDIARPVEEPAPTLRFGERANAVDWVSDRPSTTVNADNRISEPGRHDPNESGSQQKNAVRVTCEEAAVLQSFPADFPFQGSRTARFRQIGNAIPPLLAKAILGALVNPDAEG